MATLKEIYNALFPYRKIILTVVGLVLLLVAAMFVFDKCSNYFSNREIEHDKNAVNELMQNANQAKENLQNLAINEALKEQEVNLARNDLINRQAETNDAREKTNQALENLKRLENKDYTNQTLQNANKARCKAFPQGKGC